VELPKKGDVERHFKSMRGNFDTDYPLKSELRKLKFEALKSQLADEQSYFVKAILKSQAAAVASFRVSLVLAKHQMEKWRKKLSCK
jgi:hypothetical protein